ncbi:putative phage tail fiber protein [Rhizobium phage RHph_N3_13]|nr:putative phage tail fiber protein [Rhizobium phage RHph_N3_13]QIG69921.1 putative phage tail fiber protein [Rhizobium phage RHph_I3_11]
MGASYTRQSAAEIQTGEIVQASPLNAEFNQLQSAFDGSTGHSHDGTVGEGPKISLTSSITGVLPVLNGGIAGIHKTNATTAPAVTDDANDGYAVGSVWVNTTADVVYICVDATVGAAVWLTYQALDAALTSIAGLTTSADKMIYTTAADTYAVTVLTAYARTLLDDADASTALSTLGVSTFIKTLLDDADAVTARGTLGLGTIATQASNNVTITGGSVTGITDLAVADGGTGASTAANARTNLGLVIGTDVQAQDAELQAIAGLTSAADRLPYFTGSGTASLATFTAAGRALVDDADATAQRATLGLNNVDNTSDANKPVSTAQQTALDLKSNILQPFSSIAAAGTTDLGSLSTEHVTVTGNTTITSFGTVAAGTFRRVVFSGTPTLTYNATSLILPQGGNVVVVAGDSLEAVSLGSGNWRVTSYQRTGNFGLYAFVGLSAGAGVTDLSFTGIPSWARRVTLYVSELSTNGSSSIICRIGPSGGFETTGYNSGNDGGAAGTGAFNIFGGTATTAARIHGTIILGLTNPGSNTWVMSSTMIRTNTTIIGQYAAGSKALAGALNMVQITTGNGTDQFDNGEVIAYYE